MSTSSPFVAADGDGCELDMGRWSHQFCVLDFATGTLDHVLSLLVLHFVPRWRDAILMVLPGGVATVRNSSKLAP